MNFLAPTIDLAEAARRDWDAAIVGAGPAGAAAARELSLRGAKVLLIDKARHPRTKVCGCCLNARSLDALAQLGVRERIEREGAMRQTEMLLASGTRRAMLRLPSCVSFSRAALDVALIESAIDAGAAFLPETQARLAPGERGEPSIALATGAHRLILRPRTILAADGLGGNFARRALGGELVSAASKIGAGVQIDCASAKDYPAGRLTMAIGRAGYAGLVRIEDGRLNLGAALRPESVRAAGGIGAAVEALLAECGLPPIAGVARAPWQGTPALTRRPVAVAARGLFAIGDASGYVEPFTGEGIAWALAAGRAVAPLAIRAIEGWTPELIPEWTRLHRELVQKRQRLCRGVAAIAGAPVFARGATALLGAAPALAEPVLRGLNALERPSLETRPL